MVHALHREKELKSPLEARENENANIFMWCLENLWNTLSYKI